MNLSISEKEKLRQLFNNWCEKEKVNKNDFSSVERFYREVISRG